MEKEEITWGQWLCDVIIIFSVCLVIAYMESHYGRPPF